MRALNQALHAPAATLHGQRVSVRNTDGAHNLAVGSNAAVHVTLHGHVGCYAAGMNQHATVVVEGSASNGVAVATQAMRWVIHCPRPSSTSRARLLRSVQTHASSR